MKNPNLFPIGNAFGFFIFIKNNSCCYLCPEDGRILRAYLFLHWIPAISSAAVVVPNHREEEPEGIKSPKPQAQKYFTCPASSRPGSSHKSWNSTSRRGVRDA